MDYIVEVCTDPNYVVGRRDDPKKYQWKYVTTLRGMTQSEVDNWLFHEMYRTRHTYKLLDLYTARNYTVHQISRISEAQRAAWRRQPPTRNLWPATLFADPPAQT